MSCFASAGHDTYIIGGSVRDLILGKQPKDVDLVTSATLPQVGSVGATHNATLSLTAIL